MTARPTSQTIINRRRSRLSDNTPATRLMTRPENTTVAERSPTSNGVAERTMTAANLIAGPPIADPVSEIVSLIQSLTIRVSQLALTHSAHAAGLI